MKISEVEKNDRGYGMFTHCIHINRVADRFYAWREWLEKRCGAPSDSHFKKIYHNNVWGGVIMDTNS